MNQRSLSGVFVVAVLGLLCLAASAGAVPAVPGHQVTFSQPDGSEIQALLFGDEFSHGYETKSGYTILKDPASGEWKYAEATAGGRITLSGVAADDRPPAGIEKHLRNASGSIARPPAAGAAGAPPDGADEAPSPLNQGTQPVLVILTQYSNQTSRGTTASAWQSRFFGGSNSVRDFYSKASFGALNLAPASETQGTANDGVVGWVTVPRTHPQRNGPSVEDAVAKSIIAADPYVNFSAYDDDGNGSITPDELHVVMISAGWEAASGCETFGSNRVWAHQGSTYASTPVVDGVSVGGSDNYSGAYTQFGEMQCDGATGSETEHQATLGVIVHEMGHDLDLPDMYNTVVNDGHGVGKWSVMGSGSWNRLSGQSSGTTPSMPDAFSKYYEGWIEAPRESGFRSIQSAYSQPVAYRLGENPGGADWTFEVKSGWGEYFLVENRQLTGYDAALPGCGLLIWHIDESVSYWNDANGDDLHPLVGLVEADNNSSPIGPGDPFKGRSFNGSTTPSSRYYSGRQSLLGVDSIAASCSASMGATLDGDGFVEPPPGDDFEDARLLYGDSDERSGDPSTGATRQPAEPVHGGVSGGSSIWYRWTAPGNGRAVFNTAGSDFDTVLAAYQGSSVGALESLASNDDADGSPDGTSRVEFEVTAGVSYSIAIDGYGEEGNAANGMADLSFNFIPSPAVENARLDVAFSGGGSGRVVDQGSGNSCSWSCSIDLAPGTPVNLVAEPAAGSYFIGWQGPCSGVGACFFSLVQPTSVTAMFGIDTSSGGGGNGQGNAACNAARSRHGKAVKALANRKLKLRKAKGAKARKKAKRAFKRAKSELRRARSKMNSAC